jgi:hypothetical protein
MKVKFILPHGWLGNCRYLCCKGEFDEFDHIRPIEINLTTCKRFNIN